MQKSKLIEVYSRLLADLAQQTKRPLIEAHWNVSEEWVLTEAPKLDKLMWAVFESQSNPTVQTIDIESMALAMGCTVHYDPVLNPTINTIAGRSEVDCGEILFTRIHAWLDEMLYWYLKGTDITSDVRAAHQMLVFCYKAEHEPTNEQLKAAYASFEENDTAIGVWDQYFQDTGIHYPLSRVARCLVSQVIHKANWQEIAPSHGPGVVYPRKQPWEKSGFLVYYPQIDSVYPYSDWIVALPSFWGEQLVYKNMHTKERIECRIQAVPKDSRGPRLICVHPSEAIWIQQGTRYVLENVIMNHPLTRGKINFHDQSVNGQLALKASQSREFCTLDLKDASDRLSNKLVHYLFGDYAYQFLGCSRASHVWIDNRVIELRKFAPMGNALTFPVQSVVFWALVRAGISLHYGENCDDVYVFGDDIVFPSKYHLGVIRTLTRFGLIVNSGKTYVHGSFRESCGVDAWNGTDITPIRLRKTNVNTVSNAMATCDLAKRARLSGYHRVAVTLYSWVSLKYGKLAKTNNLYSQGLVEYECLEWDKLFTYETQMRFNKHLHRWEVPTRLVMQVLYAQQTDDWYHLQDSLVSLWRKYDMKKYQPLVMHVTASDLKVSSNRSFWSKAWHVGAVVDYSERGLEYPVPHRLRLRCGWTEVNMG